MNRLGVWLVCCLGICSAEAAEERAVLTLQDTGFTTINDVWFSPDGRYLAASGAGDVRIWDLSDGTLRHTLRGYRNAQIGVGNIWSVAFSPDGRFLLAGAAGYAAESHLRIYDLAHPEEIVDVLPGQEHTAARLAFSADGRWLAVLEDDLLSDNDDLAVFDWPARKLVARHAIGSASKVFAFGFGGGSELLFSVDFDQNEYRLFSGPQWQPTTLESLAKVFRSGGRARLSAITASASAQRDALQSIIDGMATDAWLSVLDDAAEYRFSDFQLDLQRGQFAMSGEHGAGAVREYWAGVWSAEGGDALALYDQHRYRVLRVAFSPDGQLCASADLLGEVHVWSTQTGAQQHRFRSLGQAVYRAALDADQRQLAFGKRPYGARDWAANHYAALDQALQLDKRLIQPPHGDLDEPVTEFPGFTLKRGADSDLFRMELVADNGPTVFYETGSQPYSWSFVPDPRGGSPRGFVVGDMNGGVAWVHTSASPAGRGRLRRWFLGVDAVATSIIPSRDGRFLVVGSSDGVVRLYSLERLQRWGDVDFFLKDTRLGTITEVGPGGQQDGLRDGDRLLQVDGQRASEFIAHWYSDLSRAAALGAGNIVRLRIQRGATESELEHRLVEGPDSVEPLLSFFQSRDGEWVIWTPQGYYDCSPGGHDLIGWRLNRGVHEEATFYPVDRFRKTLHRPELIDGVLAQGDLQAALQTVNAAVPAPTAEAVDFREAATLQRNEPPRVSFREPNDQRRVSGESVPVVVEVESINDLPIREVTVLVNGRPTEGERTVEELQSPRLRLRVTVSVKLVAGENSITVFASNAAASSKPAVVTVHRAGAPPQIERPKLFILAVGISEYADAKFNLQYPAADAQAFVAAWQAQRTFYSQVESRLLVDQEATAPQIRDAMDWLLQSVTQHDIAMIFLASHGVYDNRKNYYLATREAQPERLRSTALPYTDVTRLIADMPCKVLLFVDTCHSGGITGARALADNPWQDLVSEEVGAILFASCHPREVSLESDDWQHGAFTFALLAALRDPRSDADADGYLSVTELDLQITNRVKELTGGQQHPVTEKPPTIRNFNLSRLGDS